MYNIDPIDCSCTQKDWSLLRLGLLDYSEMLHVLQDRLTTTINDFHEVPELVAIYDCDFGT